MEIEWRHLRQWAFKEGLILGENFPKPEKRGGREHDVRFDKETGRWWKYTKPDSSGLCVTWIGDATPYLHNASPSEYLGRILDCNGIFGDDTKLEGIWWDGKGWRIITTQQDISGESLSPMEIRALMEANGWEHIPVWDGLGYENSQTFRKGDWLVADAHPGNAVQTMEGAIMPIDFILARRIV
ncbi:MAG: hypothetical protein EOP86_24780 [Verrucomicrobiaceae bacterium]|nr:MAG: hypothetical protein EOP86_24780 [Verrucomicrobiaceae bacterium]